MPHSLHGVLETSVYATDLDAARTFYGDVLGLAVLLETDGRHISFRCGTGVLHVFHPDASQASDTMPPHGAEGASHAAFAIRHDDLEPWKAHLTERGITIEEEQTWPSGGRSIYVRDPAGNSIELATADLWGEPRRADRLWQIRPAVPVDTSAQQPMEQFQSRTLRPICKLQNPLILMTVARYLQKYNTGFRADGSRRPGGEGAQPAEGGSAAEAHARRPRGRPLHRSRVRFYLDHQREVRRRLTALFTQRVLDQMDGLPLDEAA